MAVASVGAAGTALTSTGHRSPPRPHPRTAQNYVGWWSLGYASIANWNDVPRAIISRGLGQAGGHTDPAHRRPGFQPLRRTTLASYTAGVEALSPTNYWPMNDSGAIPYEGSVPGATASTTLADYSGNSDTGTAEGAMTLGASGPTTLTANAVTSAAPRASWRQRSRTPTPRAFPSWHGSRPPPPGGTILGFTSSQANTTPTSSDRTLWLDSAGNLVWEVNGGTVSEWSRPVRTTTGCGTSSSPKLARGAAALGRRGQGGQFHHPNIGRQLYGLLAPRVGIRVGMGEFARQLLPERFPG